jgi:hypothetical protein
MCDQFIIILKIRVSVSFQHNNNNKINRIASEIHLIKTTLYDLCQYTF